MRYWHSLEGTDVTDQLIEDTYNEIFLQALDTRQSRAVYEYEHQCRHCVDIERMVIWRVCALL